MAKRILVEVGRTGCLPGPPSLRTVRAVLPHTALQSVVLPARGLAGFPIGCDEGEQPMGGKEAHLSPFTPQCGAANMRSVQTDGSTQSQSAWDSPARLASGVRGTLVGLGSAGLSVTLSTFLRPLAPRPLRRFIATMDAPTSAGLSTARRISLGHVHGRSPSFRLRPPHALWPSLSHATLQRGQLPYACTGLDFANPSQARQDIRPNRVRHPTDRSLISCCFPPRLAATQLQSITGRRAHA